MRTKTSNIVKVLTLLFTLHFSLLTSTAQGWPKDYGGVMLQGFFWDSFNDTQWTRLEKQADDLATTFDLIWVPQSGNCGGTSMGYDDMYWFPGHYDSSFGSEAELRSMIKTFKAKGIGTIADVVINHRKNLSNWVDFPKETYKGVTYEMTSTDICANDDGGATKTWATKNGYSLSSNNDTGEGWDGMRDLDHKSQNVQTNVKAYLKMLLEDLGYAGFRYDMVKGYSASYTKMYNEDSKPQFSVGECWDSSNTIKNWIDGTGKTSAAFDFQFKYVVRNATDKQDWSYLGKQNEGNWPLVSKDYQSGAYRQYAVTFVENHDTEVRPDGSSNGPLRKDTLAANAYLLAMPGTPCVFLTHWKAYKQEIANMVAVRKAVGITNTSSPINMASTKDYYVVLTTGAKGKLLAVVGSKADSYTPPSDTYKKVLSGYHYAYYVSGIEPESIVFPTFKPSTFEKYDITVHVNADKVGWSSVNFWTWGGDGSHAPKNGNWPGDKLTTTTEVGGKKWYTQTYTINEDYDAVSFVFSTGSGSPQTVDVTNVTTDKFFEISTSKEGDKYLVNDVTSQYQTNSDADEIVAIINYMMGKAPADFDTKAADKNGDGKIDIADIIFIVNQLIAK
ncbi:MAG: alpha-amylase [Prevotella sp.]|nr:alpha-amylase [Prevotella sp.]